MHYTIKLIGSIGQNSTYSEQDIIRLLSSKQKDLLHGDEFTGRPSTKIHIDEKHVLKIRSEIRLNLFSAERWATQALEKERHYAVHHPSKTWFIYQEDEQAEYAVIGNICPRLTPLHQLFNDESNTIEYRLDCLAQLFTYYFALAKKAQIRLDEGLSNFGINAADNKLYYLDDDIYNWDRFVSCAHVIGVYFRALTWIDNTVAAQFAQTVRKIIIQFFEDEQYLTVLAELLRDIFVPSETQRIALENFIHTLDSRKTQSDSPNFNNSRYIALLADVHGNLPALDAVLAFLKLKNIEYGLVLGDIVGYGPYPSECIQRLQETKLTVIKGNHDHGLATGHFIRGFSSTASWVLEWSQSRITPAQKEWLAELPPVLHGDKWLALHGAPIDPTFFNAYVYEMTYTDNLDGLQKKKIPICFHGHTHLPGVYTRKKSSISDTHTTEKNVDLSAFDYALICPGSIGQPRNRQQGAQFAIYDQKENKLNYHTVMYDVDSLTKIMASEGFPQTLINILQGH